MGNLALFTPPDKRTLRVSGSFYELGCMEQAVKEWVTRKEVMFFDADCGRVAHNLALIEHD